MKCFADGLAAKKGVGERSSVRNGMPSPLHVKTESRKNHKLTLVTGLENYGIDPDALANMLKRKLGANTTVGEWKAKSGAVKAEVAVSGLWEKSVREFSFYKLATVVYAIDMNYPRGAYVTGGGATSGRLRCRQEVY